MYGIVRGYSRRRLGYNFQYNIRDTFLVIGIFFECSISKLFKSYVPNTLYRNYSNIIFRTLFKSILLESARGHIDAVRRDVPPGLWELRAFVFVKKKPVNNAHDKTRQSRVCCVR